MNFEFIRQVAKLEGWLLTYNTEIERLTIERDDETQLFKNDKEALTHVWHLAMNGSALHEYVLKTILK